MHFVLLHVLPFLVSLCIASWNDTRPIPIGATSPFSNSSSLAVAESCQANCVVHFDPPVTYAWHSFVINTTVVAATVRVTVFPKYNKTKTHSLAENLEDIGYTAQDRESGIVSTTLTYGTLTKADGGEEAITEVIIFPSVPTASFSSYWWSGVRPTATAGSSSCITQLNPATVQLPAHPYIAQPTTAANSSSSDGTNYYLVAKPAPHAIQNIGSDDAILAECQQSSASVTAMPDELMTTASFITVTVTRTETNCKPEFPCEVREEKTDIGGLLGPSGRPVPRPSPAFNAGAAAPAHAEGAASPFRPSYKEVPGIHNQADKEQGLAGVMTAHPEKSATAFSIGVGPPAMPLSARPEKPATSFMVPTRRPQAAGVDDFTFRGLGSETAQAIVTKAPPPLGTLVLGSATLAVSAVPAAPVTFGPHIESPALVAIGPKTVTIGVAATFADTIIAIKTVAGGATVAVLGNAQNGKFQTVALNGVSGANAAGGGGGGGGGDGGIFAPTPVALPQQESRARVTIGDTTLTPSSDGGFSVAGTSLALGGPPITLYGSTGAGESAGSGSPGNKPSATVLSLTTNAAGGKVLVVDGKTSILPTGPLETGRPKPAQYSGNGSTFASGSGAGSTNTGSAGASASHKNSAPGRVFRMENRWGCSAVVGIMAMISW